MKHLFDIKNKKTKAFTMIEVLVVITIIGILVLLIISSYSWISREALSVSLKNDLTSNKDLLDLYYADHNAVFPSSLDANNCPKTPVEDTTLCLKAAKGNELSYSGGGQSYTLINTHTASGITFQINEDGDLNELAQAPVKTFAYAFGSSGSDDVTAGDMIINTDGSYVVTGSLSSGGIFVSKISKNGVILNSIKWTLGGDEETFSIAKASDGGYIVAGSTSQYCSDNNDDAFIAKFNSDLELSWSNTWGGTGCDSASSVVQASDGGLVVIGDVDGSDPNTFIAKFTAEGEKSWYKAWGVGSYGHGSKIIQTSDGGYAVSANYDCGNESMAASIVRFSESGEVLWYESWGGDTSNLNVNSFIQTSDGDYLLVGGTDMDGDAFIAKFSSDGTFSWGKTWDSVGNESAESVIEVSDGSYIVTGSDNDTYKTFIAKFSSEGLPSWAKSWSAGLFADPSSLGYLNDGSIAIFGTVYGIRANQQDVFVIKYTSDGTMKNCDATMCQDLSSSVTTPNFDINSRSTTTSSPAMTISSPSASVTSLELTRTTIVDLAQ